MTDRDRLDRAIEDIAAVRADVKRNPRDIPCPECGHSDRMHVKGVSPAYAGCMVRIVDGVRQPCDCRLTPEQVRAALAEQP